MSAVLAILLLQQPQMPPELGSAKACLLQEAEQVPAEVLAEDKDSWRLVEAAVDACEAQIAVEADKQLPILAQHHPSISIAEISEALKEKAQYLVAYALIARANGRQSYGHSAEVKQ
ncbi:MAG: hypothetical protein AAGH53_05795 [Pseudomonadota bacterium]